MSENWSVIKEQVHTYRNYVKRLPAEAAKKASYCYLLTKEEIDRLLSLAGKDTSLDGIRIYLGGEMIDGHLVANAHVVACKKDGDSYNDYNVPGSLPDVALGAEKGVKPLAFAATTTTSGIDGGDGGTGTLKPCPAFCSSNNILNS